MSAVVASGPVIEGSARAVAVEEVKFLDRFACPSIVKLDDDFQRGFELFALEPSGDAIGDCHEPCDGGIDNAVDEVTIRSWDVMLQVLLREQAHVLHDDEARNVQQPQVAFPALRRRGLKLVRFM